MLCNCLEKQNWIKWGSFSRTRGHTKQSRKTVTLANKELLQVATGKHWKEFPSQWAIRERGTALKLSLGEGKGREGKGCFTSGRARRSCPDRREVAWAMVWRWMGTGWQAHSVLHCATAPCSSGEDGVIWKRRRNSVTCSVVAAPWWGHTGATDAKGSWLMNQGEVRRDRPVCSSPRWLTWGTGYKIQTP